MTSVGETLNLALSHHRDGRLQEAEAIYQEILATRPDHPDAFHLLGLVLYQSGRAQDALGPLRKAVQIRPASDVYLNSLGAALMESRQCDEAIGYFRRALKLKPDYADALSNLGNALFEKGRYDEAITSCREALRFSPGHCGALYNLANALAAQGKLDAATAHYEQAIRLRPAFPKAFNNLAGVLLLQNRWQEAVECYRRAVALDPAFSEAHKNLGSVYKDHGQADQAIACFRAAIAAKPEYPDALNRLGVTLFEKGQIDEATACYRRAIAIQPDFVEAHNNLGALLAETGHNEEAVPCYERALALKPLCAETHYNLGNALKAQGRLAEAAASFRRALDIQPEHSRSLNNLGNTLKLMGRFVKAVECYRKAVEVTPDDALLLDNVGAACKQMGLVEEAAAAYRRSLPLRPASPLYDLRIDILCPPVFPSAEALDEFHERLQAAIDRYYEMEIHADPTEIARIGCEPPFDVAYHGRDERRLRERFAGIFRHCFPDGRPPVADGFPRIAIVVTRDHEGIFLRGMRGVVEHLDPKRFDLSIVCAESGESRLRAEIGNPNVKYLPVPDDFKTTVRMIREARFDLLYFWEVGSDPFNYFLPFMCLTPVQCLGWGTNYTSGVPAIDYYISSELTETPSADSHYTEKLVRLATLPTYQYRAELTQSFKGREAFGLAQHQHVYLCAQNLRKFHPDFDGVLGRILRHDPAGVVVVTKPEYEHMEASLQDRFQARIPDVSDRIIFLPRMPYADYLALTAAADVVLDPFHYGGGVTTYDALSLAKPIVTLPSQYQRGRYTLGCYKKTGVTDCVASSPDDYVQLAHQLGTDRDRREAVMEKIRARKDVLFEDIEAVREFERFFEHALDAARRSRLE